MLRDVGTRGGAAAAASFEEFARDFDVRRYQQQQLTALQQLQQQPAVGAPLAGMQPPWPNHTCLLLPSKVAAPR
jgi:hypothetical protein